MIIRHFAIISALVLFTGMMAIPNSNRRGMDQQSFFFRYHNNNRHAKH